MAFVAAWTASTAAGDEFDTPVASVAGVEEQARGLAARIVVASRIVRRARDIGTSIRSRGIMAFEGGAIVADQ